MARMRIRSKTTPWQPWTKATRSNLANLERRHPHPKLNADASRLIADVPFLISARDAQVPPEGAWRTWMFMGGRGAGKTRAGAEWVRWAAMRAGCRRIALVGPALHDVREVMIGGESGLANLPGNLTRPIYESSRRRLVFDNGAEAFAFSAEDADSLRGPQFDAAWCDEAAAWPEGEAVWNTLQMAVRLGRAPRIVVTTTPRPAPLMRRLAAGEAIVTRAATHENAAHLSPGFTAEMQRLYGATQYGRQELFGELIDDPEDAIFSRSLIDAARVSIAPRLDAVLVAIDPPISSSDSADACGIIAAGISGSAYYVLADASARGLKPLEWAARAIDLAASIGAGRIIAEANQGGDMVRQTLETAGTRLPIDLVHATHNKLMRAWPISALYAQGHVHHVGRFAALEDEMCRFGAPRLSGSPDRVDALVWALAQLSRIHTGPWIRQL